MQICSLVTIITSTYNKFDYIEETIKSVANQKYPKIQYIITDDGSENCPCDSIYSWISKYNKGNIVDFQLIIHKKNLGTVRNLNYAYSVATGKYIINLSSDDSFYDENVIAKIVKKFERTNANVICTSRLMVDEKTQEPIRLMPPRLLRNYISKRNTPEKQFKGFVLGPTFEMASGSITSFRNSFWKSWKQFDTDFRLWEDGPFYAAYTQKGGQITFCYEIVSIRYRIGGISMGKKVNSQLEMEDKIYRKKYKLDKTKLSRFEKRLLLFNEKTRQSTINIGVIIKFLDVVIVKSIRKIMYLLSAKIDYIITKRGKY